MSEKKRQKKDGQDKGKRNQARRRANANPVGVRRSVAASQSDAPERPSPRRRGGAASAASRSTRPTANRAPTSAPPAARQKAAREAKGR
jgi:hypothetical protein